MRHYIRLVRPMNGIMSVIAVGIGALMAGAALQLSRELLLAMLAVFLVSGGGMVVNDIFDVNIDRHNRPHRPLPSGKISVNAAKAFAALLFIAGNFLGAILGREAFMITLLASTLLITYAWKLKKVLLAGHVVVSLLVALSFFFGGLIAGNIMAPLWAGLLAFVGNMGREIYKTIDDMLGDKHAGVDNIPLRYGVFRAKTVAALFLIAAIGLSFVPFVIGALDELYLFIIILADLTFVAAMGAPVRYASTFSKIGMLLALIAFILGAPQVQAALMIG